VNSCVVLAEDGTQQRSRKHDGSARPVIAAFKAELDRSRVPATVRLTRGRDIEAACGQLAVSRRSTT
jgi:adenine C2-methylase RlmN of 23S rRNA A2503 and tRNA A37